MHTKLLGGGSIWMSAPFFEMHLPKWQINREVLNREINNEGSTAITIAGDLQWACIIFQK